MRLFNCYDLLNLGVMARKFHRANPFPHIVIQDGYDSHFLKLVVKEIGRIPEDKWVQYGGGKAAFGDVLSAGKKVRSVFMDMVSDSFLDAISVMTGIRNLIVDMDFGGVGIHRTVANGGSLGIHCDFNCLKKNNGILYRRLNCFLFLNEGWQEGWGGALELWSGDEGQSGMECRVVIPPALGTFVCFEASERSWHGHPRPLKFPKGRSRLSFAVYLYTEEKPEWFKGVHSTIYVKKVT